MNESNFLSNSQARMILLSQQFSGHLSKDEVQAKFNRAGLLIDFSIKELTNMMGVKADDSAQKAVLGTWFNMGFTSAQEPFLLVDEFAKKLEAKQAGGFLSAMAGFMAGKLINGLSEQTAPALQIISQTVNKPEPEVLGKFKPIILEAVKASGEKDGLISRLKQSGVNL